MTSIHQIHIPHPADFPLLLMIWEASVRATHYFVSEEKIQQFKTMIREQELFQKSDLYCVRNVEGELTGFAGISGDSLDMLFLDPSVIGTGAGKILMRYAIDVKGVARVDVNEQNEHARGFYEHFGFKVTGRSETDENGEPYPLLHMQRGIEDFSDE